MKDIIIAIDGYSSCGKSTLAKGLAKTLGYTYIDSGAMYRAATLFCMNNNIIDNNENVDMEKLMSEIDNIDIRQVYNKKTNKNETFLNNENVEDEIRKIAVSNFVSTISKIKAVRSKLVNIQRNMAKDKRIVMDGRDIGTVVFPDAELKIFMTADTKTRAKRRYDEYMKNNTKIDFETVEQNIKKRDNIDENRKESPLRRPKDAIILDNTNMNIDQQLNFVIDIIKKKFK